MSLVPDMRSDTRIYHPPNYLTVQAHSILPICLSAVGSVDTDKSNTPDVFNIPNVTGNGAPKKNSYMSCYYQNVRGLNTKCNELFINSLLAHQQFDLIALTETWLNDSVHDSELFDSNYFSIYRRDRNFIATNTSRGGGVLIALNQKIPSTQINANSFCDIFNNLIYIDVVVVKLKLISGFLYVLVIYVPPSTTIEEYELLFDAIESLYCIYESDLLIVGDFNIPEYVKCLNNTSCVSTKFTLLDNFCNFFSLSQYNHVLNTSNRLLDLALCNSKCSIVRAADVLIPEDHYHPALLINLTAVPNGVGSFPLLSSSNFNFKKANFPDLYREIAAVDWSFLKNFSDVDAAVSQLNNMLYTLFEMYVPKKKIPTKTYPPWFNSSIIKAISEKFRAWKQFKQTGNQEHYSIFKDLRSKVKIDIDHAYKQYLVTAENDISSNPNNFWSFIQSKNNSTPIPSAMVYNNISLDNPQLIVNAFASFFSTAFTVPLTNSTQINDSSSNNNCCILNITHVTETEVINAIKSLKPKMTMGPDHIPSFLIRDCASAFVSPLTTLFNLILNCGCFPNTWKQSRVCPVFKKGEKCDIENYRPISIVCNFSKIFEIVLHKIFSHHTGNLISINQHGFIEGRSTVTNLCCKTQFICECLDKQRQVDVIYTDFSKAFDKIDHQLLLCKLHNYGFSDSLVNLIRSYLSNRSQFVQYRNFKSDTFLQVSGVPQGTVLGPLFFNLFINDIVDNLNVSYLLYADDLKLFYCINSPADCLLLQNNLNYVNTWCIQNRLCLNSSKCQVMSFSKKLDVYYFQYILDNVVLDRPSVVKDLGVTFDSNMSFVNHISCITSSAFKMLGFVLRCSRPFSNYNTLFLLFNSFVRPKLEYASVVWCPLYATHIDLIEKVQRRFLKSVVYFMDGSYPPRGIPQNHLLQRFSICSLKDRRITHSLLLLYKIINNFTKCPCLLEQIKFLAPRLSSRKCNLFYLKTPRTNILKASPLQVMCNNYNTFAETFDICCCSPSDIKRMSF